MVRIFSADLLHETSHADLNDEFHAVVATDFFETEYMERKTRIDFTGSEAQWMYES